MTHSAASATCLRALPWAAMALDVGTAMVAGRAAKGPSEIVFLAQLITLMLVGRLLGETMNRIGQPSVWACSSAASC
jgi:hypothetical protein